MKKVNIHFQIELQRVKYMRMHQSDYKMLKYKYWVLEKSENKKKISEKQKKKKRWNDPRIDSKSLLASKLINRFFRKYRRNLRICQRPNQMKFMNRKKRISAFVPTSSARKRPVTKNIIQLNPIAESRQLVEYELLQMPSILISKGRVEINIYSFHSNVKIAD